MVIYDKITSSADATERVGAELADYALAHNEEFIALYGDLGAGKTAFVRGFASVAAPEASVCSPTYTIVNEYLSAKKSVFHFDMYRIEDEDSLESIGFYDYFGRGILLTEWSENIPFALPEHFIRVTIEKLGEDRRRILVERIG